MNDDQREALSNLCNRYGVPFDEKDYGPSFDLPDGWVCGWIGGNEHQKLYVGCSPAGSISS